MANSKAQKGKRAKAIPSLYLSVARLSLVLDKPEIDIATYLDTLESIGADIRKKGKTFYLPDIIHFIFRKDYAKRLDITLKEQKLAKEKLEYILKLQQYLPKSEVYSEWARRLAVLRQELLTLEYKIAAQLSEKKRTAKEIKEILREYTNEMIRDYGKVGKYTPKIKNA